MEAHYDILAAIQNIGAKLPIQITMYHVKGHQDTGLTMVLSREVRTNIEMDKNAKEKVKKYTMPKGLTKIPGEPWSCSINSHKLVKNIEKQLRDHMHNAEITDYWTKNSGYTTQLWK